MGFFANLFRFQEGAYLQTQQALLDIAKLTPVHSTSSYRKEHCEFALPSGCHISAGTFSMPSVSELRQHCNSLTSSSSSSSLRGKQQNSPKPVDNTIRTVVGQARALHSTYEGAVFQAASQFNFLEFPSPSTTPEAGIEKYSQDATQGPACAIACAAGTAYRNYLVPVPFRNNDESAEGVQPRRGQVRDAQLNGLYAVEEYLEQIHGIIEPWSVKNGYIESDQPKLEALNQLIQETPQIRDEIISRICIGVQEDTTATDPFVQDRDIRKLVTQTYNSAISVGYSRQPAKLWEPIAKIVLEATYEATLLVGLIKTIEAKRSDRPTPPIFLTKVGGGVFQNKASWIQDAITRAVNKVLVYGIDMDIRLVQFGSHS